jgi:hypothetical protein
MNAQEENMTDGYLGNQFDAFGGDAGYPVPSWDSRAKGYKVSGIILPQPHPENGQPMSYITGQQTSMPTDENPIPQPLFFDNDPNGATYHKRPRLQAEFLIKVEPNGFEDCSDRFREFAEKNEVEDDGLRRLIIKGGPATKSMQSNGRKTFGGKGTPAIGATITQEFQGKRPKGSFKENIFEVSFERPSAENLRVVQEYMAENFPESGGIGDSFTSGPKPSTAAEPAASGSGDDPDF